MNSESNARGCTHVRQETPNWCFQACLQSFLTDNNTCRWTQGEMVELGIQKKYCEDKDPERGVIPYDKGKNPEYRNVIDFCGLFDIDLEKIEDRQIPQTLASGEGVLILTWKCKGDPNQQHCVRFCEHVNEKTFRVMDPAPHPDEFPIWDRENIQNWSCHIFRIRLKNSGKGKARYESGNMIRAAAL